MCVYVCTYMQRSIIPLPEGLLPLNPTDQPQACPEVCAQRLFQHFFLKAQQVSLPSLLYPWTSCRIERVGTMAMNNSPPTGVSSTSTSLSVHLPVESAMAHCSINWSLNTLTGGGITLFPFPLCFLSLG